MGKKNIPVATKVIPMGIEEKAGRAPFLQVNRRHRPLLAKIQCSRPVLTEQGECETQKPSTEKQEAAGLGRNSNTGQYVLIVVVVEVGTFGLRQVLHAHEYARRRDTVD
jgi:hypothetical protein